MKIHLINSITSVVSEYQKINKQNTTMIIRSWIIRHNIRSGFILRLRHPIAHFSDGNAIQLWHRTTPKRCTDHPIDSGVNESLICEQCHTPICKKTPARALN